MNSAHPGSSDRAAEHWRHSAIAVAASLSFVLLVLISFDRFYLTNDNIAILENAYAGEPVRYVSALWSLGLYHLQQLLPGDLSAYALALYAAHVIGISLFLGSIRHLDAPGYVLACLLLPYAVFYAGFLIFLDYTSASIMLGAHAIMAFAVRWQRGIASVGFTMLCAALLMLAGMIRIKGGIGLLVTGIPFLCLAWMIRLSREGYSRQSIRTLALPLLLVAPLVAMTVTDQLYKEHLAPDAYTQYERFNQLRGPLHNDLGKQAVLLDHLYNEKLLAATGWQRGDLMNFYEWIFFDERIYNTDTLQAFLAARDISKSRSRTGFFSETLPSLASLHYLNLSFAICLALALFAARRRPGINAMSVVALLAYIYVVCFVTYSTAKFPPRLGWALFMANALYILSVFPALRPGPAPAGRAVFICAAALCALMSGWTQTQTYKQVHDLKQAYREGFEYFLGAMEKVDAHAIVLVQPGQVFYDTFDPVRRPPGAIRFINVGWNTFSPRFFNQIKAINAEKGSEIIPKMASSGHAYVLGLNAWIDSLANNYLAVHQDRYLLESTGAKIARGDGAELGLYRVIEKTP